MAHCILSLLPTIRRYYSFSPNLSNASREGGCVPFHNLHGCNSPVCVFRHWSLFPPAQWSLLRDMDALPRQKSCLLRHKRNSSKACLLLGRSGRIVQVLRNRWFCPSHKNTLFLLITLRSVLGYLWIVTFEGFWSTLSSSNKLQFRYMIKKAPQTPWDCGCDQSIHYLKFHDKSYDFCKISIKLSSSDDFNLIFSRQKKLRSHIF